MSSAPSADPSPPLLDTAAVMERYGLRPRAARRIMDEAGALKAGNRLFVRVEDLIAWEEAQRSARRPAAVPPPRVTVGPRRSERREPLPEFFWQA